MKPPLRRFCALLALLFLCSTTSVFAGDASPITSTGDGAFRLTVSAHHKFTRNTDKLKEQATALATDFCAKDGKQLKVVSVAEDKSLYLVGAPASVTLTFKALAPDDPGVAPAVATPPATSVAPAAPAAPRPLSLDELKSELTKLDEMRKSGLLTDADFATLKQKLLSRF